MPSKSSSVVAIRPQQFLFRAQRWVTTLFSITLLCGILSLILLSMFFISLESATVTTGTPPKTQTVYAPSSIHKTYLVSSLVVGLVEVVLLSIMLVDYFKIFGKVYKTVPFITITSMAGIALVVIIVDIVFLSHAYHQCPKGSFLNLFSQSCQAGCNSNSDCSTGSECFNGACCNTITHYPCDDGICCEQPCQSLANGNTFCCQNVCTAKDGTKECCGLGTVCMEGSGCVSLCGTQTCKTDEYCYAIPNISIGDSTNFNMSDTFNYDASGNTVYNCLPVPSDCAAAQKPQAVPPAIDNFYTCFNSDGLDPTVYKNILNANNATLFNTIGDSEIMASPYNKPYNGYICGGSPQERAIQTCFQNCQNTSRCIQEATTDTIGLGAVTDGSGNLYCNQLISCNNTVGSTDENVSSTSLTTYSQTGIASNGSMRTAVTESFPVKSSWTPPPSSSSSNSINAYEKSCTAFPDIIANDNQWGPCTGTLITSSNYQCHKTSNNETGEVRIAAPIQYEIAISNGDWNSATILQSQCQTGQTNCFGPSTSKQLSSSPFNPANGAKYINAGDAWTINFPDLGQPFQLGFLSMSGSTNHYLTCVGGNTASIIFLKKSNPEDRSTLLDGDAVYLLLQEPISGQFRVLGHNDNVYSPSYTPLFANHGDCTTTGSCCNAGSFSSPSGDNDNWYTIQFQSSNSNDWANAYYGLGKPQPLSQSTVFYIAVGNGNEPNRGGYLTTLSNNGMITDMAGGKATFQCDSLQTSCSS